MNRAEILDTAKSLITGDRQEQYGDAAQIYKVVGKMWGDYIFEGFAKRYGPIYDSDSKQITGFVFSPQTVLTMLALMKIGREVSGNHKDDNFIDAAGYIALAGEIAGSDEQP